MIKHALTGALLLGFAGAASAQFKWTDEAGRVNYGDYPPREARNVERIDQRVPDSDDPLRTAPFELRRAASNFPVVLYSGAQCAPCDAARDLLRARGIPFSERTIASREDYDQFQRLGYGSLVPVLTVGRQAQRQFQPDDWNRLLDAAGYPRTSQLPREWSPPAPQPLVARAVLPADASAGEAGTGQQATGNTPPR
jgi:glutaredoxin